MSRALNELDTKHPRGVLAKDQRPDVKPSPVQIHSVDLCVEHGETKRLWCPVRCTEVYLAGTPNGAYSVQDTRVLRHPSPTYSTTKGHVALWIRMAISTAYSAAGADPVNIDQRSRGLGTCAFTLSI